jgi:hypothetical protein
MEKLYVARCESTRSLKPATARFQIASSNLPRPYGWRGGETVLDELERLH